MAFAGVAGLKARHHLDMPHMRRHGLRAAAQHALLDTRRAGGCPHLQCRVVVVATRRPVILLGWRADCCAVELLVAGMGCWASAVTTFASRRATLVLEPAPVPPCRLGSPWRGWRPGGRLPGTEAQLARRRVIPLGWRAVAPSARRLPRCGPGSTGQSRARARRGTPRLAHHRGVQVQRAD